MTSEDGVEKGTMEWRSPHTWGEAYNTGIVNVVLATDWTDVALDTISDRIYQTQCSIVVYL